MAKLRRIEAEERFKKTQKLDKKILLDKENAAKVVQEKMARLKALRLAKEASEAINLAKKVIKK